MKKTLTTLLCLASTWAFCANAKPTPEVNITNPSKTIVASKHHYIVTINLKSNATTGYSWFFKSASNQVVPTKEHYITPNTKLIGAPGIDQWTFLVKTSAMTVPRILPITLTYARPWDVKDGSDQTFYVITEPDTK